MRRSKEGIVIVVENQAINLINDSANEFDDAASPPRRKVASSIESLKYFQILVVSAHRLHKATKMRVRLDSARSLFKLKTTHSFLFTIGICVEPTTIVVFFATATFITTIETVSETSRTTKVTNRKALAIVIVPNVTWMLSYRTFAT